MNSNKIALVTVGTTEFEELIKSIDQRQIYQLFKDNGFKKIIFQIGRGNYKPSNMESIIEVECFGLANGLTEFYKKSDLIISHCGAGTLLECLQLKKKICVVINDSLMDNHQEELFDALKEANLVMGVKCASQFQNQIANIIKVNDQEINKYLIPQKNLIDRIINQTGN